MNKFFDRALLFLIQSLTITFFVLIIGILVKESFAYFFNKEAYFSKQETPCICPTTTKPLTTPLPHATFNSQGFMTLEGY